ncbi:hypothetical protein HT576_08955 [Haloterrigena sp. SYSU A121-1]|uniref:Uncharacterized protein n=1 Tax=Haloterrigena gelatinilytica TaxID=2741724 RepID=A0A8J8GMH6_9EURY|nr:hypothetical protein [Haloterrigena gelatinilytica]NUB91149.1 hypothetical protein [Haloterrigena gelatinilytica]
MPTRLRPVAYSASSGEADYVFNRPDHDSMGQVTFKVYGGELYDHASYDRDAEPRTPGVYCDNADRDKYTVIVDDPYLLLESALRTGVDTLNTEFDLDLELAPDDPWT